ncbi:hypothetical protein [Brachybacterium paraconglomeratum]|uniref:hypothetical protein n=1 Tax=Brachybacterium paraconglomeratum TaxID=173362 RepID=UPI0022B01B0C|nr:hypothetical protein [Brachybacterium paraconglomeratum]MCZ4326705.1 hypothetical protein [Brachybacterium paraconglomeratum]
MWCFECGTQTGMSTHFSRDVARRREQARASDGRFGEQQIERAGSVDLGGSDEAMILPDGGVAQPVDLVPGARSSAWYDAGQDRTVAETTIAIRPGDLMEVAGGDDERLYAEGASVLREVLEERYPGAMVVGSHAAAWEVQFLSDAPNQLTEEQLAEVVRHDPQGPAAFAREGNREAGGDSLREAVRRRMRGSVVASATDSSTGTDARALELAQRLSIDGPAIADLAHHGRADYKALARELQEIDVEDDRLQGAASELLAWAAAANRELRSRWS